MKKDDRQSGISEQHEGSEQKVAEWVPSPEGVHEIYSNFVHTNWSPFDLRVRFGQLIPKPGSNPDSANFVVEERAAVTVAWPQAKILSDLLQKLVASYEKANGEIKPLKLPERPA